MVGYGDYGTGSSCCEHSNQKRRVANNLLEYYGIFGLLPGQPLYFLNFDDPLKARAPRLEGIVARGDSGEPLFVRDKDGLLLQIGIASGVTLPFGIYESVAWWTPVNDYLQWIAENNPLRTVNNIEGDRTWNNPASWRDTAPAVTSKIPNNDETSAAARATIKLVYLTQVP